MYSFHRRDGTGLDPYFGIIHGTERDQGSLVFDVIEEYRAFRFRW